MSVKKIYICYVPKEEEEGEEEESQQQQQQQEEEEGGWSGFSVGKNNNGLQLLLQNGNGPPVRTATAYSCFFRTEMDLR